MLAASKRAVAMSPAGSKMLALPYQEATPAQKPRSFWSIHSIRSIAPRLELEGQAAVCKKQSTGGNP